MIKRLLTILILTLGTLSLGQSTWVGTQLRWDPVFGFQAQSRIESGLYLGDWYLAIGTQWNSRDPLRFWLGGLLWVPMGAHRLGLEIFRSLDSVGLWRFQMDWIYYLE